jgi:hypothetical protein
MPQSSIVVAEEACPTGRVVVTVAFIAPCLPPKPLEPPVAEIVAPEPVGLKDVVPPLRPDITVPLPAE